MPRRPKKCPECGSSRVATILWGMPAFSEIKDDLEAGRIVIGGCCIDDNDPKWECTDCEHRWGRARR